MESGRGKNFIYAAVGAAFGLGGVLRFPALCLTYGGAFVVAYAAVLAAFGFPLLSAELALGRSGSFPFPLKKICPAGGAVGALSAVNSAAMCVCYGVIVAVLAVRACTFHASVNYGYPADMPALTPFVAALAFMAAAFFLSRGARARAKLSRGVVAFQALMLAVLAARGLTYSNALSVLRSCFAVDAGALFSARVWSEAAGQALLSLSLAAGVMPALGADMLQKSSPFPAAAVIVCSNFAGAMLSAVAALTLAGGGGCLSAVGQSALANALVLYPAALSAAFSNAHICGLFGCLFYCSLSATALVSMLSLALPAYVWVRRAPVSARTAAISLCAALFLLCLPFAAGLSFSAAEELCCNVAAPVCAAGECACFAFRAIAKRRRGGRSVRHTFNV